MLTLGRLTTLNAKNRGGKDIKMLYYSNIHTVWETDKVGRKHPLQWNRQTSNPTFLTRWLLDLG